ncbi:MAG: hypothetical protein ACOZNI_03770 [Myxococcota bacterium]
MTPADVPPIEHHLGVGWHAFQYPLLYEGMPVRHALAIDYGMRFRVGLEAGLSARFVFPAPAEPSLAYEGDVHVDAVARIGRWRPAAGLALGASTRATSEVLEKERPPGSYFADLGTPEPLWLDFTATPARFAFGDYELGVARVGVGVSMLNVGRAGRWAIDFLSVNRTF